MVSKRRCGGALALVWVYALALVSTSAMRSRRFAARASREGDPHGCGPWLRSVRPGGSLGGARSAPGRSLGGARSAPGRSLRAAGRRPAQMLRRSRESRNTLRARQEGVGRIDPPIARLSRPTPSERSRGCCERPVVRAQSRAHLMEDTRAHARRRPGTPVGRRGPAQRPTPAPPRPRKRPTHAPGAHAGARFPSVPWPRTAARPLGRLPSRRRRALDRPPARSAGCQAAGAARSTGRPPARPAAEPRLPRARPAPRRAARPLGRPPSRRRPQAIAAGGTSLVQKAQRVAATGIWLMHSGQLRVTCSTSGSVRIRAMR
jgi:hypothetical protein